MSSKVAAVGDAADRMHLPMAFCAGKHIKAHDTHLYGRAVSGRSAARYPLRMLKQLESAGEDLRRVTLYFPTELHKRARIAAVEADVPLSEFVVHLVTKGLKK